MHSLQEVVHHQGSKRHFAKWVLFELEEHRKDKDILKMLQVNQYKQLCCPLPEQEENLI